MEQTFPRARGHDAGQERSFVGYSNSHKTLFSLDGQWTFNGSSTSPNILAICRTDLYQILKPNYFSATRKVLRGIDTKSLRFTYASGKIPRTRWAIDLGIPASNDLTIQVDVDAFIQPNREKAHADATVSATAIRHRRPYRKAEVEWLDRVQPHHRKDVTPRLRHRSRLLSDSEKRLPAFFASRLDCNNRCNLC